MTPLAIALIVLVAMFLLGLPIFMSLIISSVVAILAGGDILPDVYKRQIRTWCDLKLWHLQFNIVNRDTLLAAQKDPNSYRNLIVRVAGYSAYFCDMSPDLQNDIIDRTEHADL